jgi:hypothetical protein
MFWGEKQAPVHTRTGRLVFVSTSSAGGVGRRARSAGKALGVVALVADMWARREQRLPRSRSHCPAHAFATDRLRGASTRRGAQPLEASFQCFSITLHDR